MKAELNEPAEKKSENETAIQKTRTLTARFRLAVYLLTGLAAVGLWCWFKTLRLEIVGEEHDPFKHGKGPVIYTTWHRSFLFGVYFLRGRRGYTMASRSKDGEWAAGLVQRFGNRTVRGSSSRRGGPALHGLIEKLKEGSSGSLVTDAPLGPARKSKPGILLCAQKSGVPILPMQFAAKWCVRLNSWDRTILPLPFSRFVVKFAEPFEVDPDLEKEEFDRRLGELDVVLNQLTDEVDAYF
ncbi:MAG: lysophospholipid acyltransferase family protein [Planctomycetota bacterium]|nr:lysophospholipid acyltransferase family protein [Planctomycetota bacterium]